MNILAGKIRLRIFWSRSLKDKRAVRQRIVARCVQKFHLSMREDEMTSELLQRLDLYYCVLLGEKEKDRLAQDILDFVLSLADVEYLAYDVEIF